MNNVFKKLIQDATTTTINVDGAGFHTFSKEKFAKLIVLECVSLCRAEGERLYGLYDSGKEQMNAELLASKMEDTEIMLKEHFGLEG